MRNRPSVTDLLFEARILISKIANSSFFTSGKHGLHTARFAYLHELVPLLVTAHSPSTRLPIARRAEFVLGLTPKRHRRELGNIAVFAPTRGGKGLDAVAKILTWPHSLIINDIKGELYEMTAGYRSSIGEVFVLDPTGWGNCYDPYQGRMEEIELGRAAAKLLHGNVEGENAIFLKRARKMQKTLARAAEVEGYPVFPYMHALFRGGLDQAIARLNAVSPVLATKFLTVTTEQGNVADKFLSHSWATLDTELDPLMTDTVVSMLSRSDFKTEDLLTATRPMTIYLRWPERYLLSLAPLVRLLWHSLLDELIASFQQAQKAGSACKPVLLLIDEAGRTAIPSLAEHAATVVGQGITLCLYFQSLSQLEAIYGRANAAVILDNMETQIFYRPNRNLRTTKELEGSLGLKSDYAHSSQVREGEEVSEGKAEQAIPLIPAYLISQMRDTDVVGFHRNLPPFKGGRLDWRDFPELIRRKSIKAPEVSRLAPWTPLWEVAAAPAGEFANDTAPLNPNGYS